MDTSVWDRIASELNSLGPVCWCDLSQMVRLNYLTRRDGETLHLRMYSRTIDAVVPDGVTSLMVEPGWEDGAVAERICVVRSSAGKDRKIEKASTEAGLLVVSPGDVVSLRA